MDIAVGLDFDGGLSLLGTSFGIVNPLKAPTTGKMTEPVNVSVPDGTEYVHVVVTTVDMSFVQVALPVKDVWYEVAQHTLDTAKRSFTCQFQALLGTNAADAEWIGYFILEVQCFGR